MSTIHSAARSDSAIWCTAGGALCPRTRGATRVTRYPSTPNSGSRSTRLARLSARHIHGARDAHNVASAAGEDPRDNAGCRAVHPGGGRPETATTRAAVLYRAAVDGSRPRATCRRRNDDRGPAGGSPGGTLGLLLRAGLDTRLPLQDGSGVSTAGRRWRGSLPSQKTPALAVSGVVRDPDRSAPFPAPGVVHIKRPVRRRCRSPSNDRRTAMRSRGPSRWRCRERRG